MFGQLKQKFLKCTDCYQHLKINSFGRLQLTCVANLYIFNVESQTQTGDRKRHNKTQKSIYLSLKKEKKRKG